MQLWEILVPANWNDGTPVKVRHHRVWDAYVQEHTGGLTIMRPAKGRWKSKDGTVFQDRMIPVRFATPENMATMVMNQIMKFTAEHYDQEAVACYRVSDSFVIRTREELGVTKPMWRRRDDTYVDPSTLSAVEKFRRQMEVSD